MIPKSVLSVSFGCFTDLTSLLTDIVLSLLELFVINFVATVQYDFCNA